ncbi:MAG: TniB family NTP-binding protein [Promethearchaeota archaeon]
MEDDTRRALERSPEERKDFIEQGIWISYPKEDKVKKRLRRIRKQPKSDRPRGGLLISPTGNGKTTLVKRWIKANSRQDYDYLYVKAPVKVTIKALYIRLCVKVNVHTFSGSAEQLLQRLLRAMRDLNVKMIFIDDIHNLLTAQNDRIKDECRNALRDLSDSLKIPIVLIGIETAAKVLMGDRQLRTRYPVIKLDEWKFDKDLVPYAHTDNLEFLSLLNAFESRLPLLIESKLILPEIAETIHRIGKGILGNMVIIITETALEAIERGEERISKKLIETLDQEECFQFEDLPLEEDENG